MEWLKNIALPQSAEHIELLGYMFVILLFLFIVFSGITLWGTLLSIYLKKKESKNLDVKYRRLSKDIMDIILFNKTTGIMFCVLPIMTIIIIFAQLFQSQNNSNLNFLAYSLILLLIGLLSIYSYKNSLYNFRQVDINSGLIGSIILFFSLWFFSTAITSSVFTESSQILTVNLFSSVVLIRFILLILISLSVTGGVLLFGIFYIKDANPETDEEYTVLAKGTFLKAAFAASVFIPVLVLIDMMMLPETSLSGTFFFYLILSLLFLFIVYHLLYMLNKNINKTIAAYLLVTLILFILTYAINNQLLIAGSNRVQYAMLTTNYETYLAELKGVDKMPIINAEEIYKVSCSSCHAFDRKIVGPPHNEVIPKYFDNANQLVAFIRNPVKVNPEYPPMPNPGLKPDEAKAVAEYVILKVKESIGQ